MRRASERYHDRVARIYDSMYEGDAYWKFYREITWQHLKRFLPRDSGARVLDAGGGTGFWAQRLAKSGFAVTLCDTSQGMLERARRNLERAGLAARVVLVRSDISDLAELEDSSFDFALAQGDPLSFCRDAGSGARALGRVLRPGGVCVASVDGTYGALEPYVEREDLDGLERLLRTGRTEWLAKRPVERFPVRTFTPRELRQLFGGAGFDVLSLIGKTVLPVRQLRRRLEDRRFYLRLLRLERRLHAEESLLGRAAHLEIAARTPADGMTA